MPKSDDGYHFIIFGDRTGGPAEGIKVLQQAVKDTNLLDPDLVMTVGDLVQGYNTRELWEEQMKEYRGVMKGLRMPWFPVAGNHDITWVGEGRPATEHETDYEKHFGPLWYWFEHKKSGFLVLFSDEGDPADPAAPRDFSLPNQQKFSPTQLAWLKQSLQEMKGLQHIFVFMHHPRWAPDIYPGSNWDEVHKLLVANGNVRACFAGHIHRLRYDGIRDGIEYFALAATGGSIPGEYPDIGYLHHYNVVSVRPDGIKVAALPVGAAIDPKRYTAERGADLTLVQRMPVDLVSAPIALNAESQGGGFCEFKLTNPSKRPIEITLSPADVHEWTVVPDHAHLSLAPGASETLIFHASRRQEKSPHQVQTPRLELEVDYLEEAARIRLPSRRVSIPWRFASLPKQVFEPAAKPSGLYVGGGKSGVRVESSSFDLPDGPFTLEAWVYPDKLLPTSGMVSKAENSEYGLLTDAGHAVFMVHLDGKPVVVRSPEPLTIGRWTHVAGVFDGQALVLYLNGKEVSRSPAQGKRTRSERPLYLGADTDGKGAPTRSFSGWVDDVRLSRGARYKEAFQSKRSHQPDAQTVLLFPLDRIHADIAIPDHAASKAHGYLQGGAKIKALPSETSAAPAAKKP